MWHRLLTGLIVSAAIFCSLELHAADTPGVTGTAELTATETRTEREQIQTDMEFLAADALEGRDTGSAGILEAADYIQKVFRDAGLGTPESLPEGRQKFVIPSLPELGPDNSLAATILGASRSWVASQDFIPCSFGKAGEFEAPVVFCGYGIVDAENQYDDFAKVDVKGKIAMILRRVPGQSRPGSLYVRKNGSIDTNRGALRTKLTHAKENGAVAVLFVNDLFSTKESDDELLEFGYGGGPAGESLPCVHITQKTADELVRKSTELTLAELSDAIEKSLSPASLELPETIVTGKIDFRQQEISGYNIIGVIEPSDPEIRETVIIGAHYDHVGWGKFGSLAPGTLAIHNGADDNASGTAAILSLARLLSARSEQLSRRVVLICFSAEERGLLGSKHYVSDPVYPLEDTVAMINLDMVGRMSDEKLTVFGVGSSSVWNGWLDPIQEQTGLSFFREPKAFGPSDHAPFYEKKIPVLHLFTGLHEDYHRPTDDIGEINFMGIELVSQILAELTVRLTETNERPDYIENKKWIQVGNHAGGRPHVGISPASEQGTNGFRIGQIMQNSPADLAGLETGDVIIGGAGFRFAAVGVEGKVTSTIRDAFWAFIDSSHPGDQFPMLILRNGEERFVNLKLGKPR